MANKNLEYKINTMTLLVLFSKGNILIGTKNIIIINSTLMKKVSESVYAK